MSEQAPNKYFPFSNRFSGRILVHVLPIFSIGVAAFFLFMMRERHGTGSYIALWFIVAAVFNWFWSTRFAWRTWWDNRTRRPSSSEKLTEGEFHERRVRLAFAHPYVLLWQSFFVMTLMVWAAENPEVISLHYGIWFCLSVLVIWWIVSLFSRYIGRSELRDFDYIHRFDARKGRIKTKEGLEEHSL